VTTRNRATSRLLAHGSARLSRWCLRLWSEIPPQRLSILRVTLPPGATIAAPHSGIIEVVAVIDGDLEVTAVHGRALVCLDGSSAHPFDDTVTISAGEGVSANEAASLEYRVSGSQPVTILLMRIEANTPQLLLIP
jgi:hypothetical protein